MSVLHIAKCFVEGFALLIGIVLTGYGLIWVTYNLVKVALRKLRVDPADTDYPGLLTAAVMMFLAIGTVISLSICGILK